jgi:ribose/xylose/arabinose/galactoside ABC-type transport system permease subunit
MLLALSACVENFATANNILNLLVQVAPIGVMACGASLVMITGGIDVSGPAVMTTAAVIGADYMARTGNLLCGPLVMLLVGLVLGAVNGFGVAFLRMVALVVTLSIMTICAGIVTAWTNGQSVVGLSPAFSATFNRPTIISMFLGVALVLGFGLRKTILGRWLYCIGTNINAARITGLPTRGASFAAYAISGMCAGVAGIMNTAALSSARPGMGPDTQILDVVSAAVIGGVSVNGGSGNILGVTMGAVLIVMVSNVMNLLGIPDYFTGLIKGLVIIVAIGIDRARSAPST